MGELISVDEARASVLAAVRPLASERVAVDEALGRVLAEDVVAGFDLPPFDSSAMDGFALVAGPAGGGDGGAAAPGGGGERAPPPRT